MPHLRHHRRHHSWPHCGSELCMRETRSLDLRVSKPGGHHYANPQWTFQQAMPLVAEEEVGDDAEMAGIVRTPSRIHRMWSRPPQQVRPQEVPTTATLVGAPKHVHRSILRRLIRRPPLDKTRSLFVVPTTMAAGDRVMISGWMAPGLSAQPTVVSDRARVALSVVDSSRFRAERRHRRCHSEQPRSWREPSAGLWTLKEE